MRRVAVIGAGWAGLTAALELQRQGCLVILFERSPAHHGAGGRASTAYAAGERAPFAIDNGQHVLLGAYQSTLALMQGLGIALETTLLRLPAAWHVPGHLDLALPTWAQSPSPHSVWNTGPFKQLPMAIALFKACPVNQWPSLAAAALRLQLCTPHAQETVTNWLSRLRFPDALNDQLWRPLCYAAMNTPPAIASATVFKRVIQDGLLAGGAAAAMLVPRLDLGKVLPKAALTKLERTGAVLKQGCGVHHITCTPQGVQVFDGAHAHPFDALVCATTAKDAVRLLPTDCISPSLRALAAQAPEPITTLHLNMQRHIRLPRAVCVLPEPDGALCPLQHAVVIDRSYLDPEYIGWHTVVLSCSSAALAYSHEALVAAGLARLQTCFPDLNWPSTCEGVVIHAKQATFACTAGLTRPSMNTNQTCIVLAGDYLAGAYPATLEGAVRSGMAAAQQLCEL